MRLEHDANAFTTYPKCARNSAIRGIYHRLAEFLLPRRPESTARWRCGGRGASGSHLHNFNCFERKFSPGCRDDVAAFDLRRLMHLAVGALKIPFKFRQLQLGSEFTFHHGVGFSFRHFLLCSIARA